MARVVLVAVVVLLGAFDAAAQRLPAGAVPLHYRLTFAPDLSSDRFEGRETIDVRIDAPLTRLTLNAVGLQVRDAVVTSAGRTIVPEVSYDKALGQVSFDLGRRLQPGTLKLSLAFAGTLTADLRGLYLGRANGRKYVFTQFEATDARRAFPCFDEPAFKASFEVSAVVDAHDTAISNGPLLTDAPGPGPGKHTIRFGTTPKMSSYLVALAVGDFDCLDGSASGIPVRACGVAGRKALAEFALEAATRFLEFYNGYFSIRYPFRKLDLLAVPDFSAGAMENTAAIFFREQDLLIDPESASISSQYEVASTIAHEMAHQWFGDLVTMRWWDDLWLNEGFATWMESKPILAWKPEWQAELAEVRSAGRAMEVDGLRTTRPVRSAVSTPAEIDEAFDAIAYDKGAALLRMVEEYVTPEAFRTGVNAYLRHFAYGSATAEDFWTEIAAASGKPVDRVLPAFVDRPGVPLVTTTSRCEGTDRTVASLSQERFLVDPAAAPTGSASAWPIPVDLRGLKAPAPASAVVPILFADRQLDASLGGCAPVVFANAGARGYYRTAYPPEVLARLAAAPALLTPAERLRLLDDEWALARAGLRQAASYLSLVQAFAGDTSPDVVASMAEPLDFVHDHLLTDQDRPAFEAWVRRVFQARAADLGAPGWLSARDEDPSRRELRGAVMHVLGTAGRDPDVLARARAQIEENLRGAAVDRASLPAMAALAALTAEPELYARMARRRDNSPARDQDELLVEALTHAERPDLVASALEFAASDRIRNQDTALVLSELLANPAANQAAWGFVKAKWHTLEKKVGGLLAEPTLVAATSSFCDPVSRDDVRQFLSGRVPQARRTLDQSIERIDNCIAFRKRETAPLAQWLAGAK